jgi:type I restriction enzyme S subunit
VKNKRTPEIRFAGFTEEWKKCRLGEVSERVRGNDGRMDLPTLTISAESGWLDQRERFSANIAGNEQMNYTLLSKGELSYNHGNSKLAQYGVVFKLRNYEEALVPRVYHSFKTKGQAEGNFIEYMFATKRSDRELAKLVSSGARMDGLLNISYDAFMDIKIKIPSLNEQKKIAKFLRQLDKTITLHQQELTTLKQTKQGFLQKMFPKEGEPMPEVRFPGFTGEWEEHKLGDLINTMHCGASIAPDDYQEDGVPTVPKGAVNSLGIAVLSGSKFVSENFYQKNIKACVYSGDLVTSLRDLVPAAPNMGRIVKLFGESKEYLMPQGVYRLLLEEGVDENFMIAFSNSDKFRKIISEEKNGSTQVHIRNSEYLGIKIKAPDSAEQTQIGDFFKQLDVTIALHQRELDALKETKKAFLQKMFV